MCPIACNKGPIDYVVSTIIRCLAECGRRALLLRTDKEPAAKALADAIKAARQEETILETSHKESVM